MTKKKKNPDSAEEKIMAAARKVFLKKGYAAARTRDIATEAGINLALLNYYFESKEKLFEIVMLENMKGLLGGMEHIVNDDKTSFDKKIILIVEQYINNLTAVPEIPLFVLSELRHHPQKFIKLVNVNKMIVNSVFFQQYNELVKKKRANKMHPVHLITNIISLSVFPFVTAPVLKTIGPLSQKEFLELMQERKKMIPQWITMMIYNKIK